MRKLLLILLCLPMIGFGQISEEIQYIKIESNDWGNDVISTASTIFTNKGYTTFLKDLSKDAIDNPCSVLKCQINFKRGKKGWSNSVLKLELIDCNGRTVYKQKSSNTTNFNQPHVQNCFIKATTNIPPKTINTSITSEQKDLDFTSEESVREFFDNNAEDFEGIWQYTGGADDDFRLAIIKQDYSYELIMLESIMDFWHPGDVKGSLEPAAEEGILTIKFLPLVKSVTPKSCVGFVKSEGLIEFVIPPMLNYNGTSVSSTYSGKRMFYKVYPTLDNKKQKRTKNGEWAGNGSGIIISKSGHIITNHHVIEDADDIEVEFILDDEVQKFNAEIVQSDKVNDLAIIKILDVNFDGVDEPPYNFKTISSDVGTKVCAFGYPYALLGMGKEIKVTDGIISSKSGLDGDITKYQITAPIQGGNSGGPLFDDKGNFIGINTSGIDAIQIENVAYSVKTSYVTQLIDMLPKSIDLPSNNRLASLPLTEQIKEITKYVVLIKVK